MKQLFNVPPLKGHAPKRVRSSVNEGDIKVWSMELQAMKWEYGDTEWSKGWGVLFTDMSRTLNKLRSCLKID